MSSVWEYATKKKNEITKEVEGVCKRCGKTIQCNKGSTTSLKSHLKSHGIEITSSQSSSNFQDKKKNSIIDFIKRPSLNEIVADMATDGISIRAITRNKYIRTSLAKDGFKLPQNESRVMKLIHEDFEDKKKKMIDIFKQIIEKEKKLSMSIDEYTTVRHRRYFGINLHSQNTTYKTGLVRILGSCPAEKMVEKVSKHLELFGINYQKDLVGSTQDGAAVNKKFMKIMNIVEQFCFNHAVHLGVCDTLYKKTQECVLNNLDSSDIEENDNFDQFTDLEIIEEVDDNIDFSIILTKAREVVKFIKYSSVRNHIFQTKVVEKFGNEIELHLDVKHRWNSIPTMIDPLIKTKLCLFETFTELNSLHIINDLDFTGLLALKAAMAPVKLAVETLSREDSTLLTADTVLNFMLQKLLEQNTTFSIDLHENLKKRIDQRWNSDIMDLLKSLNNTTNIPSKSTIAYAGKLAARLFEISEDPENEELQEIQSTPEITLEDELKILLEQKTTGGVNLSSKNFKWLKQEFLLFKNTGNRTENLQKLFDACLLIKPTSTDVERVFSVSSSFCTKIRSRLSDNSLNSLVFLKFYYNKNKKNN